MTRRLRAGVFLLLSAFALGSHAATAFSYSLACDYGCTGTSTAFIPLENWDYQFGDPLRQSNLDTSAHGDVGYVSYRSADDREFTLGTFSLVSGAFTSQGDPAGGDLLFQSYDQSLTFRIAADGSWYAAVDIPTASSGLNFIHGGRGYSVTAIQSPVPEPLTYAMWLLGIGLLGLTHRRKRGN